MKAIINGIRYNTESAIEIGSGQSDAYRGDFQFWEATLYKTPKSGRYFLAGEGGPMTRYGRSVGNHNVIGSSRIDPMTEEEALEWAERFLEPEIIEAHFNHLIEDA